MASYNYILIKAVKIKYIFNQHIIIIYRRNLNSNIPTQGIIYICYLFKYIKLFVCGFEMWKNHAI